MINNAADLEENKEAPQRRSTYAMNEMKNELDDANDFVDLRGRRLIETRDRIESYSERSSQMTNTAELLKEKYKK